MKKGYSVKDLMLAMDGKDLATFMHEQESQFQSRFDVSFKQGVEVELKFTDSIDARDFYQELRFNPVYGLDYSVKTVAYDETRILVKGAPTLFDYFGTREPNLLTLSRDLNLDFDVTFVQEFTGVVFTGKVNHGELLSRQCILEVSDLLPELTLGGLSQIARSEFEFDTLLTRAYIMNSSRIV